MWLIALSLLQAVAMWQLQARWPFRSPRMQHRQFSRTIGAYAGRVTTLVDVRAWSFTRAAWFRRCREECVGSGHAALGLREDWQTQLAAAHQDLGVRRVRFHGVFDDDIGSTCATCRVLCMQGQVPHNHCCLNPVPLCSRARCGRCNRAAAAQLYKPGHGV